MTSRESSGPPTKAGRPTIRDVARLAGVDPSLVSRVVNNDPKASASEATRQRILNSVAKLGYQASAMARGLRMTRTWTLGLLLPDLGNPMYESIVRGVEGESHRLGYGVVLGDHKEDEKETFTALLRQGRVDGLLIASGVLKDSYMKRVIESGVGPIVLVNRRVRGVQTSVVVDDAAGSRMAVEHLRELGHTKIAGMFGPGGIDTSVRRRKGFLEGSRSASGIDVELLDTASWNYESGYRGALDLLRGDSPPTAIFASTLAMGIGALRAARELKLKVPRDLSVIALHDSEIADYLEPPLTTVAMPVEEMGRRAVDLLVSLIEGGAPEEVVVKGGQHLVMRASTGAPPSTGSTQPATRG